MDRWEGVLFAYVILMCDVGLEVLSQSCGFAVYVLLSALLQSRWPVPEEIVQEVQLDIRQVISE